MRHPVILAHDVGTSGTKSSVVDPRGMILDSASADHATHYGPGGRAEQEPADWWRGVCRNTRALMDRHPAFRARVAGIGVSGHMLCGLPVDASGAPLHRCMIHSDCRATREAEEIIRLLGANAVYRVTGNIVDPRSPLCKMRWLKRNRPEIYRKTARFLQSKDFITGTLTGVFDSTDRSDASHAQWLDVRKMVYAADLFAALDLDLGKLPALYRGTDVVGRLCDASARRMGLPSGIPVIAGGGDGACATGGAGATRPGDTYCCIGTTAWIASVSRTPVLDPQRRIFSIVSLDGETCAVYGTVQAAGRSLEWIMALLGEKDFRRFDRLLAGAPAGCAGLIFLPYLEGERSPIWDVHARGVFFGITPGHRREHFLRATVEGVSFALRSVLDVMRESRPIRALRLIGGGGRSAFWQQMLADIGEVEIEVLSVQAADATSLGAAIATGVGVGLFRNTADGARTIAVADTRTPCRAARPVYRRQLALYQSLYPRLRPAYAELRNLTGA